MAPYGLGARALHPLTMIIRAISLQSSTLIARIEYSMIELNGKVHVRSSGRRTS